MDHAAMAAANGAPRVPGLGKAACDRLTPRDIDIADWSRFESSLAEILAALGMDLETPGTRDTPSRFPQALCDDTAGYEGDPKLATAFQAEHIASREYAGQTSKGRSPSRPCASTTRFRSTAAPTSATLRRADIGLSKLTRIVRLFERRFAVQERLGEQIADTLAGSVAPIVALPFISRPRTSDAHARRRGALQDDRDVLERRLPRPGPAHGGPSSRSPATGNGAEI